MSPEAEFLYQKYVKFASQLCYVDLNFLVEDACGNLQVSNGRFRVFSRIEFQSFATTNSWFLRFVTYFI